MTSEWQMNEFDKEFWKELEKATSNRIMPEEELQRVIEDLVDRSSSDISAILYDDLKDRLPDMISEHAESDAGFRERNYERWKEGFDLFQMLIVASQETGEAIKNGEKKNAVATQDWKFQALVSLHARAVLVSREVFCLLKGGFPDGALGRWRTLHELAVVAKFLSQNSKETSKRYLARQHVAAFEAAKQYRKYEKEAELLPFSDNEFSKLSKRKDDIVTEFGSEISESDWGWATPDLKGRANFYEIEKAADLNHWRPRYNWACSDIHGNYRPPSAMLGTSEAKNPVLLVGSSNSAMADPAQMAARSLFIATLALIDAYSNLDRLAFAQVLDKICDEIDDVFVRLDAETLAEYQNRSGS